ncbi:hypothetical protein [Neobacillus sp.]|uniref:hypothetical protein n=1 Tax=Neobacillus sp. TaxID=2675273 RepID=UPI00289652D0|nr:hypothetical protein [Neobacillus sp.]
MKKVVKSITLATSILLLASPATSFAKTAITTNSSVKIKSQWELKGGKWYFHNNNGEYRKGWALINSKWYFFDQKGVMQTGWLKYQNKWYYLNTTGAMATGWKLVNSKWYYLDGSGAMATGWLKDKNKWYYMESSGEMASGWRNLNYNYSFGWYYFKQTGEMATDWIKDGTKSYYLLPDGRWAHHVIANGYFYEDNNMKYPGNEIIKNKVEQLKTLLSPGLTKEEVEKQTSGSLYSVDSTGSYWEYSFSTNNNDSFDTIQNGFTNLSPIDLGTGKISIKVLLSWDDNNKVRGVAIAYFSTDHRLHLYQHAHDTERDVVWFGNLID